jgi:hypothetical protein
MHTCQQLRGLFSRSHFFLGAVFLVIQLQTACGGDNDTTAKPPVIDASSLVKFEAPHAHAVAFPRLPGQPLTVSHKRSTQVIDTGTSLNQPNARPAAVLAPSTFARGGIGAEWSRCLSKA